MIGYRCKCGECIGSSSMGFQDCQGCKKCNTTYASHPDRHIELQPHTWKVMYNQNTGKPYNMCESCSEIEEESYTLAKIK